MFRDSSEILNRRLILPAQNFISSPRPNSIRHTVFAINAEKGSQSVNVELLATNVLSDNRGFVRHENNN